MGEKILKFENNTVSTFREIAKLVESIKKKNEEGDIECSDIVSLRKLVSNEDILISVTACHSLAYLATCQILPFSQVLHWLTVSSVRNAAGVVEAVADLLIFSLPSSSLSKSSEYKCPFNLSVPQHPFISILKQNPASWRCVLNQMSKILFSEDECIASNGLQLLTPVFKYVLWAPVETSSAVCCNKFWNLLITVCYASNKLKLLAETVTWIQIEHGCDVLELYHFFTELDDALVMLNDDQFTNICCVYFATIVLKSVKSGYNPTLCLQRIDKLLKKKPDAIDIVLIILAQSIDSCPAWYLNPILRTCVNISKYGLCNETFLWMVVGALLPWLFQPSTLLLETFHLADELFNIAENIQPTGSTLANQSLSSHNLFEEIIFSESTIYFAIILARLNKSLSLPDRLCTWLSGLHLEFENVPCVPPIRLFITSLMLSKKELDVKKASLEFLMKTCAGSQLPLIFYHLAREQDPEMQTILLHALPFTTANEENIAPILKTLDSFCSSGKHLLQTISLSLYVDLVKTKERCYTYLFDQLKENKAKKWDSVWEINVSQTAAIKEICTFKPHQYGQDLVGLLHNILKRCRKEQDALPFALALESLILLCDVDVLNAADVYNSLIPLLKNEKRLLVITRLCDLISLISRKSTEDENIIIQVVQKLWNYVSSHDDIAVIIAALKALSNFNIEQMPLRVLPEIYRKKVKLAAISAAKTPIDAAKSAQDLLLDIPYIPGPCWIEVLEEVNVDARTEMCNTLTVWLQVELSTFHTHMYSTIQGEPENYNNLSRRSLLRILVYYCKQLSKSNLELNESDKVTVTLCLTVINGTKRKSIPPLKWDFLQQFYNCKDDQLKKQILTLLAKQSCISISAKALMQNYITTFNIATNGDKDLEVLFTVMPDLCCGIPAVTLRPFLASATKYASEITDGGKLFSLLCGGLKAALRDNDVDESNRISVSQVIENLWNQNSTNSSIFNVLLDVATELPLTYIEHLSSPSVMWDISLETLIKVIKLRCAIALTTDNENPFIWLNDCIEATSTYLIEEKIFFENAAQVFIKYRYHQSKWCWLLELMGKIHASLQNEDQAVLKFMCDVFIFSVVVLSPHYTFLKILEKEDYYLYFPQALNSIITAHVSSQVIEWLYFMYKSCDVSEAFSNVFYKGLIATRHEEYFKNQAVWQKIFS